MRTLETSDGLTRGSGITAHLSMPVTAEINGAMQEFTGTK